MHCFSPLTPTVFLERSGRAFPHDAAVQIDGSVVTYGELLRRSRCLAALLKGYGIRYGDRVGIMTENCLHAIEANFGIPGAGGVIVSLNPWLATDDIVNQLRLVDSRILLVSSTFLLRHGPEALSDGGTRLLIVIQDEPLAGATADGVDYEGTLAASSPDRPLDEGIESELDPIVINFTSGTTGKPKGVVMSHRAAYLHALGQVLMLRLTRESRYLWTLPMFHVNGWGHIWANVVVGASQVIAELPGPNPQEEGRFVDRLCNVGVTHFAGAPRLLRRILALNNANTALRNCTVVTGGAAPSRALVKQLEALDMRLIHQYGLNETFGPYVVCEEQSSWLTNDNESRAALRSRQGVAAIHAGTGLRVLGADGVDVPADGKTNGEVVMAGNTVALGYYGAAGAVAPEFVDGWFHSGDLAVVHPDGYLEIKDRIKDIIYVETAYGWENISSIEVEAVLSQYPGVGDAALLGLKAKDSQEGAQLVAVIEPSSQAALSLEELRGYCEQRLPEHMRPSHFIVSSIPRTATGKTRKDLLLDQARRELSASL